MSFSPAIIAALISAAGSIGGGSLASRGAKETGIQGQQRQLIDQLLASLTGEGPFSELFQTDEAAFQKSFVDPAKQIFKEQISPQIQQSFISGGQQRGTGLDDTLTRAGVDLDQNLNQQFLQFQQGGQNRIAQILSQILGQGAGAPQQLTGGEAFGQAVGGFFSGQGGQKSIDRIFDEIRDSRKAATGATGTSDSRAGFAGSRL